MGTCVKKIISDDYSSWSCPTHKNLRFGKMCSAFKEQTGVRLNEDVNHMWTHSDERCEKRDSFRAIEGCVSAEKNKDSGELVCTSCGGRPMLLNPEGTFNHCEMDKREKCPKGCKSCSQIVTADGVVSDAVCMTCRPGFRPDEDSAGAVQCKDERKMVHSWSRNQGCRIFKGV